MLTTLATVKERLAIPEADVQYDGLLTAAIEAVSARFDRECNRTLARTENATHEFPAEDVHIPVPCYPVETVSKFETKTSESDGWVEVADVSYLLRNRCVISLSVPLFSQLSTLNSQLSVARVTYTGGYVLPGAVPGAGQTALPADLESAAVEQVAEWFQNRDKLGLIRYWPSGGIYLVFDQHPLLPQVVAMLRPHRRWAL